ncbi:kinase-like domain-containing protein [Gamsiella multidivaricata]|uniref:kinase-like domain-containing protein n=1 Tax=Gamsiella multidivaricata TaxID=101098 RepID=UPI0022201F66|nr:kinase-like domain-containing protein [Gamsiella multidivaricata]KAI7831422.1 kinase-like domain-containing protein [Gamsiella multidivaricata]
MAISTQGDVAPGHIWRGQRVAIKSPRTGQEESFLREVEIIKNLADRHIIQYYHYTVEEPLELIMEDAEGGDLNSAISRLQWEDKERIAGEIAHGLSYIHSLGIIHCDIKSYNVLLTKKLEAKLCDFGSAMTITDKKDKKPCDGSPGWTAPELLEDKTAYSPESDIYALGIVMWEMASSAAEPCNRRQVLEEKLEDVPHEYRNIMQACWDLDPKCRPKARAVLFLKYGCSLREIQEQLARLATGDADVQDKNLHILSQFVAGGKCDASMDTHANDLNELGRMRLEHQDFLKDRSNAIELRLEPADLRCDVAKAVKALEYYRSGLYEQAQDYARQVSHHPVGSYVLGEMYSQGHGVTKNEGEARRWHLSAARGGHAVSQHLMGVSCFKAGNHIEALKWYREAAEQENSDGQYKLGVMFYYGHGVPPDPIEAVHWMQKAANQGHISAATGMGRICLGQEKYPEAMRWCRKAAGDRISQYNIGLMYRTGWGVRPNYTTAIKWFQRAADQGYGQAQYAMGTMYRYGWGVKEDLDKTMEWYKKAVENGDPDAANELAMIVLETNRRTRLYESNQNLG